MISVETCACGDVDVEERRSSCGECAWQVVIGGSRSAVYVLMTRDEACCFLQCVIILTPKKPMAENNRYNSSLCKKWENQNDVNQEILIWRERKISGKAIFWRVRSRQNQKNPSLSAIINHFNANKGMRKIHGMHRPNILLVGSLRSSCYKRNQCCRSPSSIRYSFSESR